MRGARLPAPHEADLIREALGIRKRRTVTDEVRRQLEAARRAANPASNGSGSLRKLTA
jgi:hypothetical protein